MKDPERSYLDYNASTPLRPEVATAMAAAFGAVGNPSSVHAEGRAARALVETARERVAALIGAKPSRVIFTGSGTEAAATVLGPGLARDGAAPAQHLLMGATEHPCVLEGHRFARNSVERIPVDGNGIVDLAWLCDRLDRSSNVGVVVSVQAANNETGVIQPVSEIVDAVRRRGGLVHSDAVQAAGRLALDTRGLDAVTLSGHKLGGPKGVGAVVLGEGVQLGEAVLRGGGQERGRRAGTENVAGIVGFGAAAVLARDNLEREAQRLWSLRSEIEDCLRRIAPGVVIFGEEVERLPNTVAFAVPGLKAETALIAFDLEGVALSSGAACSSGKVRRSHVLEASGVAPALAEGALRISLGWDTTQKDVFRFAGACERVVSILYKGRASAA
jgi:cysteine desulfurase